MKRISLVLLGILLASMSCVSAADFKVEGTSFLLDGKPFQIRSGEIHYSRVPKEEWRNRIRMAKAMGLNTICTYVFWNFHESQRGQYDFTGEKDISAFVKACKDEGMWAIVRPGPYVCAEWDLGGIPAWLLAEPDIKLRTTTPSFLEPAKAWMKTMGAVLQPLSIANGGPLLMVQVENEYGHFAGESAYMDSLYQALRSGGYQGVVFTSGGPTKRMLRNGALSGQLNAVNFGSNAQNAITKLRENSPNQPDFTAEFWVGWYNHWRGPRRFVNLNDRIGDLRWMMDEEVSFNIYMFHGGTTRGLWTGADFDSRYRPITCSHDWDSPLDESGRPTEKYHAFRKVMQETVFDEKLADIPMTKSPGEVGTIRLTRQLSLLNAVPSGVKSPVPKTMEQLGQINGFLLYRTTVKGPKRGELDLGRVKDRVYVMLDGKLLGISGRTGRVATLQIDLPEGEYRLDLLVENMGRCSYGPELSEEKRGLEDSVSIAGRKLEPFEHVSLPMQEPLSGPYQDVIGDKPPGPLTFHLGKIATPNPCDTWLDMRGFGRGIVWFNGRNLGRYWAEGPPQSIFLPGCWMKEGGENEIVVLELEATDCPNEMPTSSRPLWKNDGKMEEKRE